MHNWEIDVAVLLIFFCRSEQFEKVFEQVKKARPRVLFLYQDGARDGRDDDIENIRKCREIAEDIDWDCTVYRKYQEKNYGCDPSEFIAQKWAFSIVDKCIVLEDDDVPSQSFFRYCKELLDYYENDTRINMICGMNNDDVTEQIDESYFFTRKGSIWGWASWSRVINSWDGTYSILDDEKALKRIEENSDNKKEFKKIIQRCKRHRATGKEYYETINSLTVHSNNTLNIVPKYNMITNIGVGAETTHGSSDLNLYSKKSRKLFWKKRYEIEFPLVHPKYVMRNREYEKKIQVSDFEQLIAKIEMLWYSLKYQGIKGFCKRIIKKIKKENKKRKQIKKR